jgi:hypothetical protein
MRNLKQATETISKPLGAWIRNVRDSDNKGQRYATGKVRRAEGTAKDRDAFMRELERIRAGE